MPDLDRLRPGQEARTSTGALSILTPGTTGSVLPPGVHLFTDGELVTTPGTLWLSGDSTGAYIYRFPLAVSNFDLGSVTIPAPAVATRWGVAQHFWFFRGTGPGLDTPSDWSDSHAPDAHAVWDSRADPDTYSPELLVSAGNGWATMYTVYVVVEVDADNPKPVGATIDLSDLLTVLDTLIIGPTVFSNSFTTTYIPAGGSSPVTFTGYDGHLIPYTTGAVMTVQGNQFTNPITVTIGDSTVGTGVRILAYETDTDNDGNADTPGLLRYTAPPHAPAANDDDFQAVTITTVHGSDATGQVIYVDPTLYTQISAVTPDTITATDPGTLTITGVNLEENGFYLTLWTDEQGDPYNGGYNFGSGFLTSLTATEAVLAYPFNAGDDTTYTLDPGTYHVAVGGTYYRYSDATDVILTVTA